MHGRKSGRTAMFAVAAAVLAIVGGFPASSGAAAPPQVSPFGTAAFLGDLRNANLSQPIVDMARTASGNGYWQLAKDGGVFTFGDAAFYGSTGSIQVNQPMVAIAPTTNSLGYYLMAKDGGVFTFGNAGFFGSAGDVGGEWVDMAVDPDGAGYWLLAANGTVYTSGNATAFSAAAAPPAGVRAVAIAATPAGNGLWIVYSDGTTAALGAAADLGDTTAFGTEQVVDAAANAAGDSLWLVAATGQVEVLGASTLATDAPVDRGVVAIVAHTGDGYWVTTEGPPLATISGNVVDDAGQPIAGVCVSTSAFAPTVTTTTDVNGHYTLSQVRPGQYRVLFASCPQELYLSEYYREADSFTSATVLTVNSGDALVLDTVTLSLAATLSGVVRGANGAPLPDACVVAATAARESGPVGFSHTSVTGYYRLTPLPAATYQVNFSDCNHKDHVAEFYDDAPTQATATPVTLVLGQDATANAQLAAAGSISGAVTTNDAGSLSPGTCVGAYLDGNLVSQATVQTGAYKIKGLPGGSYRVHFNDCTSGDIRNDYIDEWWNDQPTKDTAAPVAVTLGAETTGVNAVLARGATISGQVTAAAGGGAAPFGCVDAIQSSTIASRALTAISGTYTIRGLRPGSYSVRFSQCGVGGSLAPEYWQDSPAAPGTPLTLGPAENRTGINASLDPAGTLEGTVTDASGNPVVVCVEAWDGVNSLMTSTTNFNGVTGAYRLRGFNSTGYKLRFSDCTNRDNHLGTEWYANSATRSGATPVTAVAGSTVTVPTAVLDAEGVISGVVTDNFGRLVQGVCVRPILPDGTDASFSTVFTTVTGFYRVPHLAAGSYKVKFDDCNRAGYVSEWWNDAGAEASATPVTVVAGATTGSVDATLAVQGAAPPVTGVSATGGDQSADVSWTPAPAGDTTIVGYRVVANPGGAFTDLASTASSAHVTGLTNGQSYTFTVHTRHNFGMDAGAVSNAVTPAGPPGAPGQPIAVAGNGSVSLTWTAATPNGTPVTQYRITASPGGAELAVAGDALSATFAGLANGTTYTFTVRALSAAGTGGASPASAGVTPSAPPAGAPDVGVGDGGGDVLPTGGDFVVSGDGYAPFSAGDIVINSTPLKLGTFTADGNGHFSVVVKIPATFEPGLHTIVATGTAPGGAVLQQSSPVVVVPSAPATGYRLLGADGGVFAFGDAPYIDSFSDAGGVMAAAASTPSGKGYWMSTLEGVVFGSGDATVYGSLAGKKPNKQIVGMASTPSGKGYWLVASDGGIFSFGDAAFYGSTGAMVLNKSIVGMASTASGKGYWLVASDGGIFSFGDAAFYGSTGAMVLNKPIVGMSASPTGKGYRLVASDGGIFSFGDAAFYGSTGAMVLNKPIVGMASTPSGKGYRLVASDGGIFTFGDASYLGSTGGITLNKPVIALF